MALLPMQRPLPVQFSTSAPRGKEIIWACDARARPRAIFRNNFIYSFTRRTLTMAKCALLLVPIMMLASLIGVEAVAEAIAGKQSRIVFVINTVIQILSFIYFTLFRL